MNRRGIPVFLIITASALLFATGAVAKDLTDATGQWRDVLEGDIATIMGYVEESSGDLMIPGELDGCPVTDIGYMAFDW